MPRRIPRYQRTLIRWLHKNSARFLVPVRLKKTNSKKVTIEFANHPNGLFVSLNESNLGVWIFWEGEFWDMLADWDVYPLKTRSGYRCRWCEESNQVWPSLEALWAEHLFEPFLEWVNSEFAQADTIRLFGSPDKEGTWARLSQHGKPSHFKNAAEEIRLHTTLKPS